MFKYRRPEFKGNRYIIALILLLAIFTLACPPTCPPDCPPQRERVVLIFSDVTSSLLEKESQQVGTLTSNVLDSLPPGTQYYVYPIQIEALKLEPMYEGRVIGQDRAARKAVSDARKNKISEEIKRLYALIKSDRRSDAYGKPDNHTCILYTLQFAQKVFKQFDQKNTDFDLIYVSDMIEECNTTPMGKPISLGQANISEAIKLAKETDLNLDLSYARVSMIIPAATDATYTASGRPNLSDVQDFWEAILLHCGFSEDSLKDSRKFYFKSGLPLYFTSQ
jgi:hypothetical protein